MSLVSRLPGQKDKLARDRSRYIQEHYTNRKQRLTERAVLSSSGGLQWPEDMF